MRYIYNGKGNSFIIGVPARDLTEDEFDALTKIQKETALKTGLYKADEPEKKEPKAEVK